MDIVVLAGGLSSERDVSFKSGTMVAKALRNRGHRALVLDVFMGYGDAECDITDIFLNSEENSVKVSDLPSEAPDIEAIKESRADKSASFFGPNVIKICQKADIVFMALHGGDGESGKVQAAFDLYGIEYTGNDYLSSAIAMDKQLTKEFLERAGVPVPVGVSLKKGNLLMSSMQLWMQPLNGKMRLLLSSLFRVESFQMVLLRERLFQLLRLLQSRASMIIKINMLLVQQ